MSESGIKINYAILEQAQTLGMVEQNYQKLKQIFKIILAADKHHWDRYINHAILAHNTTYHQILKSTPTENFHGRIPCEVLDLKFSNPMQRNRTKIQLQTLIDEVTQKYKDTTANIFEAFHKYKNYYDKKASAQPLEIGEYRILVNPKYHTQSDKTQFRAFLWNGP